ncbi:MAG: tetratricopeptide repeat protein, partial [Desulfovibrionaceae bacterium]|nr:tetratricopeptide repeat protein [Desulfovibrionaceae bacterium]
MHPYDKKHALYIIKKFSNCIAFNIPYSSHSAITAINPLYRVYNIVKEILFSEFSPANFRRYFFQRYNLQERKARYKYVLSRIKTRELNYNLSRWKIVCKKRPKRSIGLIGAAQACDKLQLYSEMESYAEKAIAKFPDNANCHIVYAQAAERRKEWDEALERWKRVSIKYSERAEGLIGVARVYDKLKLYSQMESYAQKAIEKFPDNANCQIVYAQAAERREDWDNALDRWQHVSINHSDKSEGFIGAAQACDKLKLYSQMESYAQKAIKKFPDNAKCQIVYAQAAERREDWDNALDRWKR